MIKILRCLLEGIHRPTDIFIFVSIIFSYVLFTRFIKATQKEIVSMPQRLSMPAVNMQLKKNNKYIDGWLEAMLYNSALPIGHWNYGKHIAEE